LTNAITGRRHHLDPRAEDLIAAGAGKVNDLLTTEQVAAWLGVSMQWLEIGRHHGYGPPYVRISPRMIRYRRGDVLTWLAGRTHTCTADCHTSRKRRNRGAEART
jgi:predicted DNA-binding transcriptional regulator AlpA